MSDSRIRESYGQGRLTLVDRLGIWLSQRAIRKCLPRRSDLEILELGCGYRATQLMALEPFIKRGIGVDFHIAPELQALPRYTFHESPIKEALLKIEGEKMDVVLLISVVEHLSEAQPVLQSAWNILNPSGVLLINVPTWFGKAFLEFSAFRLGLSPEVEMDDHKMYYAKRDLWPLLVAVGFRPSQIRMRYHKFGLNLFVCATK